MKKTSSLFTLLLSVILLNSLVIAKALDTSSAVAIRVQNLNMQMAPDSHIFSEALLPGEIVDTELSHIILAGSFSQSEYLSKEYDTIFLFIKGAGRLKAGDQIFNIKPESIAFPISFNIITLKVEKHDTLHYVKIRKKLSPQDLVDLHNFPDGNRSGIYFKNFDDCKAYTEKIKSPNTVSRTVLPKEYIPRVAMGTVQTIGPDAVGAHEHPMLDQLFLGLAGNDVVVHADHKKVAFKEFALLHIPIGSSHWVTVEKGKNMYYQWMDFFLTKKGEEWLKTHKPIEEYKKK